MKTLIVEDDLVSRLLLERFLKKYGPVHMALNGKEALEAVKLADETGEPYDLICLDIMMPEMDGQQALKEMRAMEEARDLSLSRRVKIIMTTALADKENVIEAIRGKCDAFLVKPFQKARLLEELRRLNLIR
jgi:Response regulator containing CheY-like receiver, AAA-type ATPase, and DNA-binding domains